MEEAMEGFEKIRDLINERSGMFFGDSKKTFLQVRLTPRLKRTNSDTLKDYYYYLKYDPNGEAELCNLIDSITVNETFFFRHQEQLDDFCDEVAPILLSRSKSRQPLILWSAGCATGEEPYTLAMLLLESPLGIRPDAINIIASDISASSLRSAREGVYDAHSLRHTPRAFMERYFNVNGDGKYTITQRVRRLVKFCSINLTDSVAAARMRDVDCIFCRNVIIYFDDAHKAKCAENLYQALRYGGYLFLGYSETLGRISTLFQPVRLKTTVAYRKPE